MQALINELNVESNVNFDLQNIRNLKKSQNSSSNVSFSDFLNSAKNEMKTSDNKEEISKKDNVEDKKSIKKDDTKDVSSSAIVDKKTEKSEAVENREDNHVVQQKNEVIENADSKKELKLDKKLDLKDVKSEKNKKVETKSNEKSKKTVVDSKSEIKNIESIKKAESITQKISKSVGKAKEVVDEKSIQKITENDFYKLAQLTDNKDNLEISEEIASYIPVEVMENKPADVEIEKEDNIEIKLDDLSVAENNFDDENPVNSEKTRFLDKDEKIVVKDFRTEKIENETVDKGQKDFTTEIHFDNENTATITMDMNVQNTESNVLSLNSQVAGSDGSNFQAMMNNQIQANIPEFVKTGSIILKDNNQGSINLILHPDDLGNVKISLSLDGKSVTGHIIVATKEAMEAFKNNAQDLREAFIKNGFDAANFDVSYNNNNSNNNQNNFENQFNGNEYIARKVYNTEVSVESSFDEKIEINQNFSNYSINIVA